MRPLTKKGEKNLRAQRQKFPISHKQKKTGKIRDGEKSEDAREEKEIGSAAKEEGTDVGEKGPEGRGRRRFFISFALKRRGVSFKHTDSAHQSQLKYDRIWPRSSRERYLEVQVLVGLLMTASFKERNGVSMEMNESRRPHRSGTENLSHEGEFCVVTSLVLLPKRTLPGKLKGGFAH